MLGVGISNTIGVNIGGQQEPMVFNDRLGDPAIQKILLHIRAANVIDPEYTAIKRILEWGIEGSSTGLDAVYAKQQASIEKV